MNPAVGGAHHAESTVQQKSRRLTGEILDDEEPVHQGAISDCSVDGLSGSEDEVETDLRWI